ncbi:MAG TPA: hypothetical protein PLS00_01275, partial [Niabella sp.]|nr:hypothetical protein [Niabella sp.]
IYITMALACIATGAFAQQTRIYTDPLVNYKQAKAFFQKEQYSLAYPLFKGSQLQIGIGYPFIF